jgi:hypothetical protein
MVNTVRTPFPAGHFYSPVVDPEALKLRRAQLWPDSPAIPLIDFNDESHADFLREMVDLMPAYDYPEKVDAAQSPTAFYTQNDQFSWLDPRVLFCMLRKVKPKRIIEIGSGYSTLLMADVNSRWLDGQVAITCVEPYPRPFLRELKGISELVVLPVQEVDLSVFSVLQPGDILFVDSSHVSKTGSDVNHIFFNILPVIQPGVIIHFHDIFFPSDYPPDWVLGEARSWNEQYLLQAVLMYGNAFEVVFGNYYAFCHHRELVAAALNRAPEKVYGGGSFWLRKR